MRATMGSGMLIREHSFTIYMEALWNVKPECNRVDQRSNRVGTQLGFPTGGRSKLSVLHPCLRVHLSPLLHAESSYGIGNGYRQLAAETSWVGLSLFSVIPVSGGLIGGSRASRTVFAALIVRADGSPFA